MCLLKNFLFGLRGRKLIYAPLLFILLHFVQNASAQKSEAYYDSLIENQANAREFHREGFYAMYAKEYEKALDLFNQAIALDTIQAHYFSNRGNVKQNLKDWQGALQDYAKANQIEPSSNHETYFQAGEIYQKHLKDYENAISSYTQSIAVAKSNESYYEFHLNYLNRGNTYLKMGNSEKAIADYDEAIQLYNEFGNAYLNRGVAKFNLKQNQSACEDWRKAVEFGTSGGNIYLEKYCK